MLKKKVSHSRWAELLERLKPFQEGESGLYHSAFCELQNAFLRRNNEESRAACLDKAEEIIVKLEKYHKQDPKERRSE